MTAVAEGLQASTGAGRGSNSPKSVGLTAVGQTGEEPTAGALAVAYPNPLVRLAEGLWVRYSFNRPRSFATGNLAFSDPADQGQRSESVSLAALV